MKTKSAVQKPAGAVAIKQALFFFWELTIEQIAAATGSTRRTVFAHVKASPGSKVLAWSDRTDDQQIEAAEKAEKFL